MCEALMEIMEPQLQAKLQERENVGIEEGLRQGIQGNVEILRELGQTDFEIKSIIIRKYNLSDEEANGYLL